MYVCITRCIPGAQGGQKRELDPVELEVQIVVSFDIGTKICVLLNH